MCKVLVLRKSSLLAKLSPQSRLWRLVMFFQTYACPEYASLLYGSRLVLPGARFGWLRTDLPGGDVRSGRRSYVEVCPLGRAIDWWELIFCNCLRWCSCCACFVAAWCRACCRRGAPACGSSSRCCMLRFICFLSLHVYDGFWSSSTCSWCFPCLTCYCCNWSRSSHLCWLVPQ